MDTNINTDFISLDMIQTAGIAALALILGIWMTKRLRWLQKYCIPTPVSGGIIFSIITLALYTFFHIEISFDGTLKDLFMLAFFTTVGFQCNMKNIKNGGRQLVIMLILLFVIIVMQNSVGVGIAKVLNVNPLIGVAAGSVAMTGGHGTAGGFASVFENLGLQGAGTLSMAAATFGLIAGSLLGGPLAERLISHKLKNKVPVTHSESTTKDEAVETSSQVGKKQINTVESECQHYAFAVYYIIIVMAAGTLLSWLLTMTGVTFPTYFGALILAAIFRNIIGGLSETKHFKKIDESFDMDRITNVGNICLSMFLGMAMISLRLWELESLALPLLAILFAQVLMLALFTYFLAFRVLGGDYDAAVLVSGICGFGLGATPNAMANMGAVCSKYHYTVKPFIIVPIIGSIFCDIFNTTIISVFLSLLN